VRDISLKPGDLILIHTDGLNAEAINELSQQLPGLRNSGQRLDTSAMFQTESILRRTGVSDDVTATFVYHEK